MLYYVLREGLADKVSFEQRPEGSQGTSHADIWDQAERKASAKALRQACVCCVPGSTRYNCCLSRVGWGRISGNEIRQAARGKIKVRTWTRLYTRWDSNRGLEHRGDVKASSLWLGYAEFVMMISHSCGNQVDSKREVWIWGEDGNRNFSFGPIKSWKWMSHPGIDCGQRRLSAGTLQLLEAE